MSTSHPMCFINIKLHLMPGAWCPVPSAWCPAFQIFSQKVFLSHNVGFSKLCREAQAESYVGNSQLGLPMGEIMFGARCLFTSRQFSSILVNFRQFSSIFGPGGSQASIFGPGREFSSEASLLKILFSSILVNCRPWRVPAVNFRPWPSINARLWWEIGHWEV